MFAHCDVNAFYASCQTAFRPDLKGRPVVVLSNNDGCVIARSAEAKPFVKMGEPYFKQKAAFLRHGVVAFSSNYELYADMSSRVMATLEELTPRCEIYSIDEAFCDVSGVRHCRDLTDFGREIRATVLQRTHLTLGVGIAPTKTLAKLANHAAKQWPRQTGGVVDLSCPQRQRKLMALLPVSEVWGIGRRIGIRVELHHGIVIRKPGRVCVPRIQSGIFQQAQPPMPGGIRLATTAQPIVPIVWMTAQVLPGQRRAIQM